MKILLALLLLIPSLSWGKLDLKSNDVYWCQEIDSSFFYRKDGRWNTIIKDLTSYIVEILPDESCAYDKPNPQNYDNLEGYSEDFLCIKRFESGKKEFSNNYFSKVVYHKGNLKYMDLDYLGTDFFKILGDSSFTFVSNNTLNGDYDPWLRSSYGSCHKAKYE